MGTVAMGIQYLARSSIVVHPTELVPCVVSAGMAIQSQSCPQNV